MRINFLVGEFASVLRASQRQKGYPILFFIFSAPLYGWTLVSSNTMAWDTSKLIVHVDPARCSIEPAELFDRVDRATQGWNRVSGVSITLETSREPIFISIPDFKLGKTSPTPVVFCDHQFGSRFEVDAHSVPAITSLRGSQNQITYAGITLNAQPGARAEVSRLNRDQFTVILAHELGHVLGLGHSGSKEALMYYSVKDKYDAELNQDDIQGLSYLYPSREWASQPFGCAAAKSVGRSDSIPFSAALLCAWILITLSLGRRYGRGAYVQ